MTQEFTQQLLECIAKTLHKPVETYRLDASFEELGIDSLDGINILFALENEFNIQIPDDAARNVKNLGEMAQGVWKLVEAKGAPA